MLAVVVQALIRISRRALKNAWMYALAAAAFVGIFFLTLPFPLVVIGAGLIGLLGSRLDAERFVVASGHAASATGDGDARESRTVTQRHTGASWRRAAKVTLVWLPLWFVPLIALFATLGEDNVFFQIGLFFSKLAVVTFGGAYAVLAYMAQAAVEQYGWLAAGEMLDGLGMAETTPGPLIQVVQFVAFMGAFRDAGMLNPYAAGMFASVLATWVTFVPCFLWIFLGAPYVESLRENRAVAAALSAITAAVVGVMLNLAVWFALHVLFAMVRAEYLYGIRFLIPDFSSVRTVGTVLVVGAFVALLRYRVSALPVLAVTAGLGICHFLILGSPG